MKTFLLLPLVFTWSLAETMSINTPYRGDLYDQVKPFMVELFDRNDYTVDFEPLPAKRGLVNANKGDDDGDGPRFNVVEKKFTNLRRVDVPILTTSLHAYTRDPSIQVKTWKDIKPYHVGVRTGAVIHVNNVKKVNPKEVTYVASNRKLFELLDQGKIDLLIVEKVMGRGMQKKLTLKDMKVSPALLRKNTFLYLHKKHTNKIKDFEKTLLQMKEEGYQERLRHFYETGESAW